MNSTKVKVAPPLAAEEPASLWFRRRRRSRVRRALTATASNLTVYGLSVLLFAPVVLFFLAGLWSSILYARTLITLWDLLTSWQIQGALDSVDHVEFAVRMALASGAFFALLFSLIVICSALLGRRWRLLLLIPGLLFAIPSLLIFVISMQAAADIVITSFALPAFLAPLAAAYALADAAVLSAFLTDLRPRLRRRSRMPKPSTVQLPIVRFGPPVAPALTAVAATSTEPNFYDDSPSDPRMEATVARALDESLPVAILPVAGEQHDDAPVREQGEALA